jgi:hypothetical protein
VLKLLSDSEVRAVDSEPLTAWLLQLRDVPMVCIECWIPVLGLLFHFLAQLWAKMRGKPAPAAPVCPISSKSAAQGALPAEHPPVAPAAEPSKPAPAAAPAAEAPAAAVAAAS